MRMALTLAREAFERGEVPVGAVVVSGDTVIGKGMNSCEHLCDSTAHAEMLALTAAEHHLGAKVLSHCTLYVTVEPCVMCAAASAWAQIGSLVYGTGDNKKGFHTVTPSILHPRTEVISGILQQECAMMMQSFFRNLR
jgi:tRNA(adenine34) deaminase